MTHERRPSFAEWRELELETFETLVDTHSFEAMIEANKVEDKMRVSFDQLVMEADDLPREIAEGHHFPVRFELTDFSAELTRMRSEENPDLWSLSMAYAVQGQDYQMFTTPDATILRTQNFEGAELEYRFPSDTSTRLLAAITAVHMGIPQERLAELFERNCTTGPESLAELLRMVGMYDQSSSLQRERLAWLPLLEDERAMVVKLSELESLDHSGRKLEYTLAWNIADFLSTELKSLQVDYAKSAGQEPYYSQRAGLSYSPDQLLIVKQLGGISEIGTLFDSYSSRSSHALAATSIMQVLRPYLEPHLHLDVDVVNPGDDEA